MTVELCAILIEEFSISAREAGLFVGYIDSYASYTRQEGKLVAEVAVVAACAPLAVPPSLPMPASKVQVALGLLDAQRTTLCVAADSTGFDALFSPLVGGRRLSTALAWLRDCHLSVVLGEDRLGVAL